MLFKRENLQKIFKLTVFKHQDYANFKCLMWGHIMNNLILKKENLDRINSFIYHIA